MSLGVVLKTELNGKPARSNPYSDPQSVEFGFRARRFARVRELIEAVLARRGHCEILDLGGTETYWRVGENFIAENRSRLRVTLLNRQASEEIRDRQIFRFVQDSATRPDLLDGARFDLVHSNSVIEHVGDWSNMERFAANVRRLAPSYYVQTPNYWMPYEPHFRCLGFQYLPRRLRIALLRRFPIGYFPRAKDWEEARAVVDEHRLLTTKEMRALFPDARIEFEKLLGWNKSILAVRD